MLTAEQSSDLCFLENSRARLVFRSIADRWQHELLWRGADGWQSVLKSVEGTAQQPVPPSPAFQELRLERIDDDTAEFQVFGRAGQGVYSAAIRFSAGLGMIDFDVAARASKAEASLGLSSRYAVSQAAIECAGEPAELRLTWPAVCLKVVAAVGTTISRAGTSNGFEQFDVGQSFPDVGKPAKNPRNSRWQYRIALPGQP